MNAQQLRSRLQEVRLERHEPPMYSVPGRVACLVDRALSTTSDAGARRNHAIARALEDAHHSAIVISIPGPAPERHPGGRGAVDLPQRIDGVTYLHADPLDELRQDTAIIDALQALLRIYKPAVVLIAAAAPAALAAAIAARELGLPYCYDIRDWQGEHESALIACASQAFSASADPSEGGGQGVTVLPGPAHPPARPDQAFAALLAPLRALSGPADASQPGMRELLAAAAQQRQRALRVAAVMDDFTYSSYAPECDLLQLTPQHALDELQRFQPALLFIESAWRGKDELWGNKVATLSSELRAILAWCKSRCIPTVFWNKEDPVHFSTFITTARQFDVVFTTDIDCIARYKSALQHERVFLLPFAAQPLSHNPVETYQRKDAFCFAGAYYVRYPDRIKDLEGYIDALPAFRPIEIFDRNFGKNDPNYQFPPPYQPFIVGTLAFTEIDKAYKGYRYAINLNSIKQSQTMYARRVYELLASNTITVSNYSRGLRLMFGDLVITTDSGRDMVQRLRELAGSEELSGKLRLAGLRKAMLEHTYAHRLAYVANKALHLPVASRLPTMVVAAYARNARELQQLLAHFSRQTHLQRRLILVHEGPAPAAAGAGLRLIAAPVAATLGLAGLLRRGEWLAPMLAQDYYGPNYLLDLALASTYAPIDLAGKAAHYACSDGQAALREASLAYRPAALLPARASAIRAAALPEQTLMALLTGLADPACGWRTVPNLAIDPYNYCRDGGLGLEDGLEDGLESAAAIARTVDDLPCDSGIGIDALLQQAECIPAQAPFDTVQHGLQADQLAALFGDIRHAAISTQLLPSGWRIASRLADGKHDYLYAATDLPLADLAMQGEIKSHFTLSPGLNVMLALYFLSSDKAVQQTVILTPNANHVTAIPEHSSFLRLGLRVYGSGSAELGALGWQHRDQRPALVLGRQPYLLVTNQYPADDALYRNAFVHSRLRAYRQHGVRADVFTLGKSAHPVYREYEDVDIVSGDGGVLETLLENASCHTILVHFLDAAMWDVLRKFAGRKRIIVWVHGVDIQAWHRRAFLYPDDAARAQAMRSCAARSAFWQDLLREPPPLFQLVFVSRFFADEAMHDLGLVLPPALYRIIHNPIDTDLFGWQPKPAAQRHKILSIRPYASLVYANDLTVKVILALAAQPFFGALEFRLIGDGPLFDDTLAPLRGFANVIIEKTFLPQSQIAALHRDYGIFLCPSRSDTQGVSRDEAMASGLVPVTNAVAAIPEFVDGDCGMLAPAEDVAALAAAITRLVHDPALFLALSAQAARRVRGQSAKEAVTLQELALIRPALPADAAPEGAP